MAAADCDLCVMAGLRACDGCGTPVWDADELNDATLIRDAFGRELCFWCI